MVKNRILKYFDYWCFLCGLGWNSSFDSCIIKTELAIVKFVNWYGKIVSFWLLCAIVVTIREKQFKMYDRILLFSASWTDIGLLYYTCLVCIGAVTRGVDIVLYQVIILCSMRTSLFSGFCISNANWHLESRSFYTNLPI